MDGSILELATIGNRDMDKPDLSKCTDTYEYYRRMVEWQNDRLEKLEAFYEAVKTVFLDKNMNVEAAIVDIGSCLTKVDPGWHK